MNPRLEFGAENLERNRWFVSLETYENSPIGTFENSLPIYGWVQTNRKPASPVRDERAALGNRRHWTKSFSAVPKGLNPSRGPNRALKRGAILGFPCSDIIL
jgi:hypothetical protein